jgi:hypothetical protein
MPHPMETWDRVWSTPVPPLMETGPYIEWSFLWRSDE